MGRIKSTSLPPQLRVAQCFSVNYKPYETWIFNVGFRAEINTLFHQFTLERRTVPVEYFIEIHQNRTPRFLRRTQISSRK